MGNNEEGHQEMKGGLRFVLGVVVRRGGRRRGLGNAKTRWRVGEGEVSW